MPAVRAEGVAFRYRPRAGRALTSPRRARGSPSADDPPEQAVLTSVSLNCGAGEVLGLLGPNGAGKSTLLRCLATLLAPTEGSIRLLGEPAHPPGSELRKRIGYAGDTPVHFEALDGREATLFFARAGGLSAAAARDRADALLRRLGLEEAGDRPAAEYSFGMRRKLLLAQALAHGPRLVFFDEPTVGLDPAAREVLYELVRECATHGAAIVIATHDTDAALRLCDRVVFLEGGRVLLEGAPAELVRRFAAGTRIEVHLAAELRDPRLDGVETLEAAPDRLVLRAAEGGAVLPGLCAGLVRQGAQIRSIHVREPSLGDVFRAVTGRPLDGPSGRAPGANGARP